MTTPCGYFWNKNIFQSNPFDRLRAWFFERVWGNLKIPRFCSGRLRRFSQFPLFLLILFLVQAGTSEGSTDTSFEAEKKFAIHFCELQAHVEFAKTCWDEGQDLTAFFLLERAKNVLFDPKRFLIVFDHQFHQKPLNDFTEKSLQALLAQTPENDILKWESVLQYHLLKENFKEAEQVLHLLREHNPDLYRYALQSDQVAALITGQSTRQFREIFFERNPDSFESQFYRDQETDFGNERQKEETLLQKFPDNVELKVWLAGRYAKEGQLIKAETLFEKLARNAEHNHKATGDHKAAGAAIVFIQTASFYENMKHDVDLALKNYSLAYFKDPECKTTVTVAQKIVELASRQAIALFESARGFVIAEQTKPAKHALSSLNPKLQILSLEWFADQDPKSNKEIFLKNLRNRDTTTRWRACEILIEEHLLSESEVDTLAQSEHPFEKGLSLYIATTTKHPKANVYLKQAIQSEVQLLRFDAISALIQSADELKSPLFSETTTLIQEHLKSEKNPWLRTLIQSWLKKSSKFELSTDVTEDTDKNRRQHT